MPKILGTLTILTSDRQSSSRDLNQLLTDSGHLVMARLGVNVQKHCVEHCTGMIVLALEGDAAKIEKLSEDLHQIPGVKARLAVMAEEEDSVS
jgi:metal-responsive CopG/Arc/MetJ family transcriptional regulator